MIYAFRDCELDADRQELRRAGVPIPLEPKAYQVLRYLVERRERLVTREEILEHVWPGVYVDDSAVSRCMICLRRAIGDSPKGQVIQTRRGYGYQLTVAVEVRTAPQVAFPPAIPAGGAEPPPAAPLLKKVLDVQKARQLLTDFLANAPESAAGWVVGHDGQCLVASPPAAAMDFRAMVEQLQHTGSVVLAPPYAGSPLWLHTAFLGGVILQGQGEAVGPDLVRTLRQLGAALTPCLALGAERREILMETLDSYRELSCLYTMAEAMEAALNVEQMARLIPDTSRTILKAANSSVMLLEPHSGELVMQAASGVEHCRKAALKRGWGIAGLVAQTGQPEIVNDTQADPRFVQYTGMVQALLCVPLKTRDRVLGVVNVSNKHAGQMFTARDAKLLMALASQAAVAMDNARLLAALQEPRGRYGQENSDR